MNQSVAPSGKHLLRGTVGILLAEGLMLPTGLLTAAFLTRHLEPMGYGLLTLTATIVAWVEWSIASMFARTTVKFIGEAEDWRAIGATLVRLYLGISLFAALLLWILAPHLAHSLKEPVLERYLRVFAIDIPIFGLAQAHQNTLIGLGLFHRRAFASMGRWLARLLLIVWLVGSGFAVAGAIWATIGASLVDLTIGRLSIRPSLYRHRPFPMRHLWGYAMPLFFSALCLRTFDKIDLITFKILGGTADQTGFYGAAQNLAVIPGLVALSFTPTLLSNLSHLQRLGETDRAKQMARQALRLVITLLPLGGITAGSAQEVVQFVFGATFAPTAPLLSILFLGALFMVIQSVATVGLIAGGKPNWMLFMTLPLPVLALLGHLWLIPRLGTLGAALVTTVLSGLAAIATVILLDQLWQIQPPIATLARSLVISALLYGLAIHWPVQGFFLFLKFFTLLLMIPIAFWGLGELKTKDIQLIYTLVLGHR